MKSIVSGQVQVLQCCKLLYGDKGEGTWVVRILRRESLDPNEYQDGIRIWSISELYLKDESE